MALHLEEYSPEAIRDWVTRCLERDLIGPGWEEDSQTVNEFEILDVGGSGAPNRYYLTGMLAPQYGDDTSTEDIPPELAHGSSSSSDEGGVGSENDDPSDESVDEKQSWTDSGAMGLTVRPLALDNSFNITVSWGEYVSDKDSNGRVWKRAPFSFEFDCIPSEIPHGERKYLDFPDDEADGVVLLVERTGSDSEPLITIRLANMRTRNPSKAANTLYQTKIELEGEFRDARSPSAQDDVLMDLLYRNSEVFARGHMVAVDWNHDGSKIWTTFLARHLVPEMVFKEELGKMLPNIELLANKSEVHRALEDLREFINAFQKWGQESKIRAQEEDLSTELMKQFEDNHTTLQSNVTRMSDGIEFLQNNKQALEAFILANRAIMESQRHETLASEYCIPNFTWKPFQIAFILLNLRGTVDKEHQDREMVDLAWFPTGGGKTEAYLGLIAFASFFRRISEPTQGRERSAPSVTTIMRYTLRLLTADQAARLVRLVGGMNAVAERNELGHGSGFAPFRVGMWIGKDASPNRLYPSKFANWRRGSAERLISDAKEGIPIRGATIAPFSTCPWCGDASVGQVESYEITKEGWSNPRPRVATQCKNNKCAFSEEVPFTAVDDDIYLNPPTILLATADKFVQAAYNPSAKNAGDGYNAYSVRRLLGMEVNEGDNRPLPPEIVIQDELHLLSGPLGTMAGLLETALAVAWKETSGHKPKYIAATATIRGADRDVGLMYGRSLNVFPPPLLDASDNFFSTASESRGRLHVGILASGARARSALEQSAASMLSSSTVAKNSGVDVAAVDPYWTLVMYYNSLRELGGGMTAVQQNVPRWMSQYGGEDGMRDFSAQPIELTSRRSSSELSEYRGRLNHSLSSDLPVVDVLHTSNMFQVGIDIKRLGAMAIIGQPRSNSEYIQSSGRVGRGKGPGLVLSLLRDRFPRDLSHFELFKSFHQELFRHVDRTSITPFALRAIDRGAPTILMLLLRMTSHILAPNAGLMLLRERQHKRNGRKIINAFESSIRERMGFDADDLSQDILEDGLKSIRKEWDLFCDVADRLKTLDMKLHWILWNDYSRGPKDASFFSSPFRTEDLTENQDLRTPISSLRDITEEILMFTQGKERQIRTSLPETHLFGHAAPGSIWEKDGLSWMTSGVPLWEMSEGGFNQKNQGGLVINEPMLSELYGKQVRLLELPRATEQTLQARGDEKPLAVHHDRYPLNWICSGEIGHIETKAKWVRMENEEKYSPFCSREGCNNKTHSGRFVSVCGDGHVTDFDYHRWVHTGKTGCKYSESKLEIQYGRNAAFTLEDWNVKCTSCGASRTMKDVPWIKSDDKHAWDCKGDRPWIKRYGKDANQKCEEGLIHLQVGNTALTYPKRTQVLLIPPKVGWEVGDDPKYTFLRTQRGESRVDGWRFAEKFLEQDLENTGFEDSDELRERIEEYWEHQESALTFETLRSRERMGIVQGDGCRHSPVRFLAKDVAGGAKQRPDSWSEPTWPLRQLVRLDRLTVLNIIDGFTRVNGSGETQPIDDPLHREDGADEPYSIAMHNHGEGVFFDLKPDWLSDIAQNRIDKFGEERAGMVYARDRFHEGMTRTIPSLQDASTFYMSAFTTLHTLSHMLIKEFSAMSGFSLGSLSERLYLETNETDSGILSAGILLYTSSPSSDGTLGGLVQQAASIERVENLVRRSLENLLSCSNDPICMDHEPDAGSENGAACHACILLPETACEFANMSLDRRWGQR